MSEGKISPYLILLVLFSPAYFILGKIWFSLIKEEIQKLKNIKEKKNLSHVAIYSSRLKSLMEVEQKNHVFCEISDPSTIEYQFKSKQGLDNAKPNDVLIYMATNNEELKLLYRKMTANREHEAEFWADVYSIINIQTPSSDISRSKIKKQRFLKLEEKVCKNYLDSFRLDTTITINMVYYTPSGRYKYKRSFNTDYKGIEEAYSAVSQHRAKRIEAEKERSKLTAKLRRQVLLRDNFHCVICGRGAEDGVKLHVDHIKPISKGGKSELSNLRTLCDSCNLGKGDTYNPNGLN